MRDRDDKFVTASQRLRDAGEKQRAHARYDRSEDQYRALFESIDEGFCTIEVLFNTAGEGADYRFLQTNPAFERLVGLKDVVGKTMRELSPQYDERWYEICGHIALTGEAHRFENRADAQGRWYEVHAFRVGEPEQRRVGVLFKDIKERKLAEIALRESAEQQAFLLKLSDTLRPVADPVEVTERASQLLGEHLGADRVFYVEYHAEAGFGEVLRDYVAPGLPSLVGRYPFESFRTSIDRISDGRTWVVDDLEADRCVGAGERDYYNTVGIISWTNVPVLKRGQLEAAFCVVQAAPRHWSEAEVRLIEETADRTWAALQRSRAEAALRMSEAKFRSLFESMDEAFYLVEIVRDEDGRPVDLIYLDENAAGIRLIGIPVLARRLGELNPRALSEWLPIFDRVAQSGNPERFEKISTASRQWQDYHVFPSGSGKDRLGVLSSSISARKLAEEALRESEARFRAIANMSPIIIWMSDVDSRCVYLNQPWLDFTGQTLEDALAEGGWGRPIHPEDVRGIQSAYVRAHERRESFQLYFRLRRADGEYRWIVSSGAPRFDGDGSFAGFVGSSIDITERRQAEEALATINQRLADAQEDERGRIARELHDDIVQRLAGLGWQIGAASDPARGVPEGAIRDFAGIRAEVMNLAKDVQALSHRLHPAWIELFGVGPAAQALCRGVSRQSGVEVDCQIDDVPETLSSKSAVCLHRVLQEALQNAVKHSGSPKVEVSLRAAGDEIEMVVKDFGVGFDPALRGHSGLGLTSMKERLKAVGGRFSIVSAQDGTTINAYVPVGQTETDAPE